ncbi:unnamed protein product [Rotaria socialis]|uniref:[histone H3]-lysine(36) N-trimethyltransferase n=2 Tax=Rotaria socialis TaxID=392032 RepID=A0A817PZM0_9BILA|nr:unnamed protein product [Rotaria socialis]CAF4333499.1 unnamed protein product [Rotaria socialis]
MSELNVASSTTDSVVILSESTSTPTLSLSSSSNTVDDEARRRKILSKLWGKGNKLSHKVRELDKSTGNNSSDLLIPTDNDHKQLTEFSDITSTCSSTTDPKSNLEDNSNSINSSKPLAVVKPIVVVKSGLIISSSTDRTRVNTEASSTIVTQTDQTTITGIERESSSVTTDRTSNKKKKSHKIKDSKKKKITRNESKDRDRSNYNHHQTNKNQESNSSSKSNRQHKDENISSNDCHYTSSRHHSSSTMSSTKNNRRSPSNDNHQVNRRSNRSSVASRKDESSHTIKSTSSPNDHHHNRHHSNSKHESNNHQSSSSRRHHRRGSSITPSPSPSRSHHSTVNTDRLQTNTSSSPKKDDRNSMSVTKLHRQQNELVSNSKSTNSISSSVSHSKLRGHGSDTIVDENNCKHRTRISDENLTNSSKHQKSLEISPGHRRSSLIVVKQEKSTTILNNERNDSNQEKQCSSRYNRRSHSRHRSKSKSKDKTNRKLAEPSNSDDSSVNQNKINDEKISTTVNENSHNDKKSNHRSRIASPNDEYRRKSSSDHHRYNRHDSPSNYDRRNDYHHRHDHHHRTPPSHSYYPHTHYVHHHHHHYRTGSSRHYDRRRSISPRSHQRCSRNVSSTSSSLSSSPRRRSSSRTSSSSSRSSSSYSSISRTSSSRSSSRNNHYYHHHHHEKKFRRSPTLEKIFLKASESIESISTQKNPNVSSSNHLIPIQTSNMNSDIQISSTMRSLSETNAFYSENFSGFSVPPPPFTLQLQQRCLKEITTESITPRRFVLNEVQTVQSSTSSTVDEVKPMKTVELNDHSSNAQVRSSSSKPVRVSRFSDIAPAVIPEPVLNINLPVDTILNYCQISENINCLSSSRRQKKRHNREVMECECTTSEYDRSHGTKACGHECLNRMLLIECGPLCPCGQWCTNRRFQRRSYANHKLALFKTEMKGYGLRTIAPIHKGRFLVEYVGEVVDMDELARRSKKYKRDGNVHQYVMSLIHGTVIDSTIKGNWARFINHSCEPNCVAEKWLVNGEYRMGIFAKRDLNITEEITIDYRFETFGATDLINEKCYCGALTCRGTISVKNNNNNSNQRQNQRQPLDDDEILEYLVDDNTNEYIMPKTVDDIRQLIQIMSRTDSENIRTIELDLIKNSSQKQFELPRLFLECNGLHVLCSWMKDILIDDDEQQYTNEFKYYLLDFIHSVLPIKDRTIVIKNGLLDLVYKKLQLPLQKTDDLGSNDQEPIGSLLNSMLNHLNDPIISKLFYLYSTWMSLKERYIIPKRKEPEQNSNYHHRHHHHHHHHHHHSSKTPSEENNYRFNFSARSSATQQKSNDRPYARRSFVVRDIPRTQDQQLSKDERRKLFEQQYEDAEKARTMAAAAAALNDESLAMQNEPPQKKQRTSDSLDPMVPSTPPQSQSSSMSDINSWTFPTNTVNSQQIDQTFWIHQHLSQFPVDYIRSYMASIGQPISVSNSSIDKDEPPIPPPPRPSHENELSRIIYLPLGWSVAACPSDSAVYFYNRQTMTTSWTPPSLTTPNEHSISNSLPPPPLDLSPLSSAQIHEKYHRHHDQQQQQLSSSSRSTMKPIKHSQRHSRSHRHHHHITSSNNKRKRVSETVESTTVISEELDSQLKDETSMIISNEQFKQDEINDKNSVEHTDELSANVSQVPIDENNENNVSITVKESSEINDNVDKHVSLNPNTLSSSSSKSYRELLRKNISQHVHTTLKPYTKRTCKQGRIISTDDIKYLVKKFTLAVLDKEIEKAKNDGIPLSPILTERVRLKTEVYVKKYMNKVGPVFQRHDSTVHPSSQPPQQTTTTTTATTALNPE